MSTQKAQELDEPTKDLVPGVREQVGVLASNKPDGLLLQEPKG